MTDPDPDSSEVRELTDEEYDATYATGEPHYLPAELLEQLPGDRDDVRAARP